VFEVCDLNVLWMCLGFALKERKKRKLTEQEEENLSKSFKPDYLKSFLRKIVSKSPF